MCVNWLDTNNKAKTLMDVLMQLAALAGSLVSFSHLVSHLLIELHRKLCKANCPFRVRNPGFPAILPFRLSLLVCFFSFLNLAKILPKLKEIAQWLCLSLPEANQKEFYRHLMACINQTFEFVLQKFSFFSFVKMIKYVIIF